MSLLFSRLMVFLAAVSMTSFAFADSDFPQITGRTCKQHLMTGVLSQTWTSLLNNNERIQEQIRQHNAQIAEYNRTNDPDRSTISSVLDLPISRIAGLGSNLDDSVGVRNAIEAEANVIAQCQQHCAGLQGRDSSGELTPFKCDNIGQGSSNQLKTFASSDLYMADDAVSSLNEQQLAELFGSQNNNVEAPAVTPNVVVDENPAPQNNTVPERNYVGPEQKIVL